MKKERIIEFMRLLGKQPFTTMQDEKDEHYFMVYPPIGSDVAVVAAFRGMSFRRPLGYISATLDEEQCVINEYDFTDQAMAHGIDKQMLQIMKGVCQDHKWTARISEDLPSEVQTLLMEFVW